MTTTRRHLFGGAAALAVTSAIPASLAPVATATPDHADLATLVHDLADDLRAMPKADCPDALRPFWFVANLPPEELPELVDAIDRLRALRTSAGVPPTMTTQEAIDADLIFEWRRSDTHVCLFAANAVNASSV